MSKLSLMKIMSKIFLLLGGLGLCLGWIYLLKFSWMITFKVYTFDSMNFDILFIFDWMSVLFFSILVMMVSCVMKFSNLYMDDDLKNWRFMSILLLFVLSMSFLIFFPKFIFLLMGWDGLGVTSFLLMIYYLSSSSWSAGLKTYLVKRLGDAFLLCSMALLFCQGHWKIFSFEMMWSFFYFLLILGLTTKSAIFPFSSWLPAAMAAPTPVSALVHSSTLVTAGIYLIIRLKYFFPSFFLKFLGVMSLWTLYFSSFSACFEWDSKKIIAYSTLSQLGLMGVCLSLGLNLFAFFHLLSHAVFKALLFICVGYLMKISFHFQDLRNLKNIWWSNPLCKILILISILALSGFPFLAGFYSKDSIMELNLKIFKMVFFLLFLFSLPFTSFYSFRLLFYLMQNSMGKMKFLSFKVKFKLFFGFPLVLLSIFIGLMLNKFLFICCFPSFSFKIFILFLMSMGFLLSFSLNFSYNWFFSKLFFKKSLKKIFLFNFSNLGKIVFKIFDSGWKKIIVKSLSKNISKSSNFVNYSMSYFFNPNFFFYVGWMCLIIFFFSKIF